MARPRLQVTSVTIGTSQPSRLADFYARLLSRPVTTDDPPVPGDADKGGWAQIRPPDGEPGPTLNFEFERCYVAPVWPSTEGAQIATQHLDIWVDDLDASVAWALDQGARLADHQPQQAVRVLLDPDGHPFCLFA